MSLALQVASPDQQKLVVVSVSPQSRASLAAHFQLDPTDTAKKLTTFFKMLGRPGQGEASCPSGLPAPYAPHVLYLHHLCRLD